MSIPDPSPWMEAAATLAGILQDENTALRASDFAAAAALLAAKRAALQSIEALRPGDPKQTVRETILRLDHLAVENRELLKHGIGIQSQVLGIIAGAVRAAAAFGYGSSGKTAIRTGAFTRSAQA